MTSCKWKQSNSKGKRLLSTFILYIYTIQSSLGIRGFAQRRKHSLLVNVFESNDGTVEVMFKTSDLPKEETTRMPVHVHIRMHYCRNSLRYITTIGFGGLEVACWPLVPKFAGSNPAEAVGFLRAKKSSARLPSEGK